MSVKNIEKNKFVKKYEWVGDVKSYKEPKDNEHSINYWEPNREYDSEYFLLGSQ
jgi:hypothetical protein